MLALDVGLIGSLEGLGSACGLLHARISWEECGLSGSSSSSEVRLWSLILSVISCNLCLSCCSSRSTSFHWGRGELLLGVGEVCLGTKHRQCDWDKSTQHTVNVFTLDLEWLDRQPNGNCYTDLKCTARVNAWCIIHKCSITDYVFLFSYSSFLFQAKNKQTAVYFGGLGYSPCNYNLTYSLDLRETLQDFPWLPINHLLSIIHLQILFWQMLHIANTRALL